MFDASENSNRDESSTDTYSQAVALETVSKPERTLPSLLHILKMEVESREKNAASSRGDVRTNNRGGNSNHERKSWKLCLETINRES